MPAFGLGGFQLHPGHEREQPARTRAKKRLPAHDRPAVLSRVPLPTVLIFRSLLARASVHRGVACSLRLSGRFKAQPSSNARRCNPPSELRSLDSVETDEMWVRKERTVAPSNPFDILL